MPLDISGFVTPEQKFEGLYKIGESLVKEKADAQKLASANRKALQSSLKYMANPKDYYTGTLADPQINQKFFEIAQAGYDYIDENPTATDAQLKAYMNPLIQEVSDWSWKAKTARKAIEDAKKTLDPRYYDINKFSDIATKNAFVNEDGTPKDAASIQIGNPYDILGTNPEITTSAALDEWRKKQPVNTFETEKEFGARPGTVTKEQLKISAPSWGIVEVDDKNQPIVDDMGRGRIIPRYEIAKDGYEPITHNGEDVKLLTDEDYNSIMSSHPSMQHFVNAQLRQHLPEYKDEQGNPIQLGDPKADLVAKNILWEYLKNTNPGSFQIKDYKVTTTRAPRGGGGRGGSADGGAYRDYYSEIDDIMKKGQEALDEENQDKWDEPGGKTVTIFKPFTLNGNDLNTDTGERVIDVINKRFPESKYNLDEIYIVKNEKGKYEARAINDDKLLTPISKAINTGGQPGKPGKEKGVHETEQENVEKRNENVGGKINGGGKININGQKGKKLWERS
jgi:hypothetical protein